MLAVQTLNAPWDDDVVARWEAVVQHDPDATTFHTPRFLRTWMAALGGRVDARVKLFTRDGEPVGVFAEQLERVGTPAGPLRELRFLGGSDVTDYLGPIAAPADRDDVAAAWIASIVEDRAWDEVVAGGLAEDTGWSVLIARHAREAGFEVGHGRDDVCPRVPLPGDADGWLRALTGKQRHELRRKARKLAREVGEVEVVRATRDELDGALTSFLDLASSAVGAKGRFFVDGRMRDFFAALVAEFGPDGTLRIDRLLVGGSDAAATVSLVWQGTVGLYNSAFDQGLGRYAPGMVLVGELVREAADEGYGWYDLLRGDEPYKYRYGAVERPLDRLTITRS